MTKKKVVKRGPRRKEDPSELIRVRTLRSVRGRWMTRGEFEELKKKRKKQENNEEDWYLIPGIF